LVINHNSLLVTIATTKSFAACSIRTDADHPQVTRQLKRFQASKPLGLGALLTFGLIGFQAGAETAERDRKTAFARGPRASASFSNFHLSI
jgi:hypothetical protein